MFKALYFKNFRLFYAGFFLSNTGNMMQSVAVSWLVFKITDSTLMVGTLFFVKQLMIFILSPIAGSFADTYKRSHILLTTSLLSGITGLLLSLFTFKGSMTITYLLGYQMLEGILTGVDLTSRQAFLKDMVRGKSFIRNAIALNSLLFNMARISGPLIAGYIMTDSHGYSGEATCFLINGISFLMVSVSILLMKNLRNETVRLKENVYQKIIQGFKYTHKQYDIRDMIMLTAIMGFFGFPLSILLPDIAKNSLAGGSKELGFMTTFIGVGAVIGGVFLANSKKFTTYHRYIIAGSFIYGLSILSCVLIDHLLVACTAMMMIGLGQSMVFTSGNSIIQTLAANNMVGRTMSIYIMLFMGATTVGIFTAGHVAERYGTSLVLTYSGWGCIASILLYMTMLQWRKKEPKNTTSPA
jgi:MFS family permease